MNEETKKIYNFQVGSFRFNRFKELYDSIKDRTGSTDLQCAILNDEGAHIVSFLLNYEKEASKHRFVFIMEPPNMTMLKMHDELYSKVRKELPRFQAIGSIATMAPGAGGTGRKLYGYKNIGELN